MNEKNESDIVKDETNESKIVQTSENKTSEQKYLEEILYLKAERENISKRHLEEKNKITKYAIENFASELVSIKESLEFGLAIETDDVKSLKNGMELTLQQLTNVFEKFGVKEINPIGETFNAYEHQAINTIHHERPENTVVEVLRKGYSLNDRLLKPALVVVSKGNE